MTNAFLLQPLAPAIAVDPGAAAGTAAANLLGDAGDLMGLVWRSTNAAAATLIVDFGAATLIDFAAFLSVTPAVFTQQLRAYDTLANAQAGLAAGRSYDSGAIVGAAGAVVPSSGRQNSWLEIAGGHAQRFWRFDLTGTAAAFEAARLVIGKRILLSRNYSFGLAPGVRDTGSIDWTPAGAMMRRFGVRQRTLDIAFECLTTDEVETQISPLLEALGNTRPLLLVTDPDPHAQRSRRMFFGFLAGDQKLPRRLYNKWAWQLALQSVI